MPVAISSSGLKQRRILPWGISGCSRRWRAVVTIVATPDLSSAPRSVLPLAVMTSWPRQARSLGVLRREGLRGIVGEDDGLAGVGAVDEGLGGAGEIGGGVDVGAPRHDGHGVGHGRGDGGEDEAGGDKGDLGGAEGGELGDEQAQEIPLARRAGNGGRSSDRLRVSMCT